MKKPKYILFDLGNVLVYIHPEAFLQTLGIGTQESRQYYRPHVVEIVRRYERGDDTTEQYLDRLDDLFNHSRGGSETYPYGGNRHFTREDFTQAMLAVVGKPVEGMEDLVRRVASSVLVGLLSNTNPLHYDSCRSALPVLQLIPHHFLSFQLRSLKPEPLIFEKVLKQLPFEAREILYIDDLEENLSAADQGGLGCHLFRGTPELQALLRTLGIM
ncbi:MAG: HAD-IA family hydrolase [Ignavibacteria bacterium]|nr:HAD-IA family hydrolase [Ignavibacteria bacterium]